jgi:hypothetical protein
MPSDICRRAMTSDRHAVDAFLPNIEPDAGKNLDALAEAKPHTQFSTTSEKAASSEVGRATDAVKICFLSFIRFPDYKSTSSQLTLGMARAKALANTGDLTLRQKRITTKHAKKEKSQMITWMRNAPGYRVESCGYFEFSEGFGFSDDLG